MYLVQYIKEFHQLARYHVQDYVAYHVIMNVLNLVQQHVGIDVEMHVPLLAVIHVQDALANVWIHVKLNVKIPKVLHVLNLVQVLSKLFHLVVQVESLQRIHCHQRRIHVVVAVIHVNFTPIRKPHVGMQVVWVNVSHHAIIRVLIVVMVDVLITAVKTRVTIKLVRVEVVPPDVQSTVLVYAKIHAPANAYKHVTMGANKNALITARMNVLLAVELIAQIIVVMHVLVVQVNVVVLVELKQMLIHAVVAVHTADVCQHV